MINEVCLLKKMFVSILVFFIMFSNIGCTKKSSDVTIVTTGLSFTAEIVFDGVKFDCFTDVIDSNRMIFTFISPEAIEGLKVIFQNGSMNMEYNGLEYKSSSGFNIYPLNSVYNVFKTASYSKNIKESGNANITLYVDSIEYEIKVGQTGLPIEIKCPSKKLYVNIKNCTIK